MAGFVINKIPEFTSCYAAQVIFFEPNFLKLQ